MTIPWTSAARVTAALQLHQPDRVPFFLPVTLHGARRLGLGVREYFSRPENVVRGQVELLALLGHDIVTAFHYAAAEVEAYGGTVEFYDDGPPNAGPPPLTKQRLGALEVPRIEDTPSLVRTLEATRGLAAAVGPVPVFGAVVSPFSLGVPLLGFESYFDLLLEDLPACERLWLVAEELCVAWGRAQVAAGAAGLAFHDPLGSPAIVPRELYLRTGLPIARRIVARLGCAVVYSFASARGLGVVPDVLGAGVAGVTASFGEDLATLKATCSGKAAVVGGLDGIPMCGWTPAQADAAVRAALAKGGPGGGFVLSENHGEIPVAVPEATLVAVAEAARRHGRYPLEDDS